MEIKVERVEYRAIEPLRELYRAEAKCQIIHDSILRRGLADPYLIQVDGSVGGYGGVWNRYDPGMVMEFYTLPHLRGEAMRMFRAFALSSAATSMEAQTNMPLMTLMLLDFTKDVRAENVLFASAFQSRLECPDAILRRHRAGDPLGADGEPEGDWVLEVKGEAVGSGGYLTHYNPPYGDIYMSVLERHRGKGYGTYIVQEVKRVCYAEGKEPAARCNATNAASRSTLQKAGMLPVGRLLIGQVDPSRLE